MAQPVGSLSVELSASVAAFQRDLGKAATAVDSAAAKMNRSLAAMEKSFRASAAGLQSFIVKGALAVLGIQSVGSAMRGALNTMRDMSDQAAKLGVHVDRDVAAQAAAAARQTDILAFSIKQRLAQAMTNLLMLLPSVRDGMQRTFGLEGMSTENLGKTLDQQLSNITDLENKLRDFNLHGQHGKSPGEITATRKMYEDQIAGAKNTVAEIQSIFDKRNKDGVNVGLDNDPVFDEWVRSNTVGRDAVYETVAALKFQEEQLGRTALQQRVWNELQKAGTDLSTPAGIAIMQMVHSLQAQEDALAGLNQQVIENDAVYDEYIAGLMDDAAFAGLQKAIKDASDAEEAARQNVVAWKETFASAAVDMLMRVTSVKEGVRELAREIIAAGLRKFVVNGIIDALADQLGFGGARAGGGPVTAGTSYLVGERGPELMTAGSSGHITPLQGSRGGSSRTVIGSINVGQGASVAAVAALQRMLTHVNASIEPRAVAANSAARRRGGGR